MLGTTIALGIGATLVTFGLPKLVSVVFPENKTGFPSSIYLIGASIGSAAAFSIGRPLIGPVLGGWRSLFFWTGIVSLLYAVIYTVVVKCYQSRVQNISNTEKNESVMILNGIKTILLHSELRLVVIMGVSYLIISHGLQGWLPTVLEERGLSANLAGQTTTLYIIANMIGILTIPGLADRLNIRRKTIMLSSTTAGFGVVAIIGGGLTPLMILGIIGAGLGVGGLSPMVRAIPPALDNIGARLTGTAIGLVFAIGEIGGFLGPFLIGFLRDITGSFIPGLSILAISGMASFVAGYQLESID